MRISVSTRLRAVTDVLRNGKVAISPEPHAPLSPAAPEPEPSSEATALIYELLDAHCDTVEMAGELTGDPRWQAHLEYLRALQRKGREVLARMPADEGGR
jgi:hypothetical protein